LPYAVGSFQGTAFGAEQHLYRSGLLDSVFRISVNLKGGPAMAPKEFTNWKQKILLGASLKVTAPTGQYDPTKLINWGANRWSFKPEFGYSQRWGHWVVDGYVGFWFFTTNQDFWSRNIYYPGTRSQSQNPIGALEGHLSNDFKPRLWASLDGNFWFGGSTSVNGVQNPLTRESDSRLGGTVAVPMKAVLETGPITNHVNFVNNRNGKFAYVTIGGANEVKAFRRGSNPELVATIPVGSLPHGIWPSGDGSRVYVALENGSMAVAIDTVSNKVIASIPIGQTTQALVYVPNAVPNGSGAENLSPLGEAADTARLHLEAGGSTLPDAQASVAVNSLGLVDLLQIAAEGLTPKSQYQVYLADSDHAPFGKLEPLAILRTNPDGAGIVQTVGPLKSVSAGTATDAAMGPRKFLVVSELSDPSRVILQQTRPSDGD
jgi:YVTN family beta-propeller protein